MRRGRFLLVGAGLALLAFIALLGAGCAAPRPVGPFGPVDGTLRPCPSSPNCACTFEDGGPAPLAFDGDAEAALARLLSYLEAEEDVVVERVDGWYVHAVFSTATLGFEDDVEFLVQPAERRIQVRSASRVGWWDLGANRRRIERIRAEW